MPRRTDGNGNVSGKQQPNSDRHVPHAMHGETGQRTDGATYVRNVKRVDVHRVGAGVGGGGGGSGSAGFAESGGGGGLGSRDGTRFRSLDADAGMGAFCALHAVMATAEPKHTKRRAH